LRNHKRHMGMIFPQVFQKALGRIAFAVIFGAAIRFLSRIMLPK